MQPAGDRARGLINPRLARRVTQTRRYLIVAVAVGIGSTLFLVIQAVLLGTIVQRVLIGRVRLAGVLPLVVALAGAFAARAAMAWLAELAAHRTSASVTSTLRRQLLTGAVARGPAWLAGERTGELASSATQGIDAIEVYFARYLPTAVLAAMAPLLILAWVLWSDWPSFVILCVTVSVVPLFMILLGLEAKRHAARQWARLAGLAATFFDLLQGLPTLRAFGRQYAGRRTLEKADDEFRTSTMKTLRVAFLSSLALEVLASVGTALVALFLGLRLLNGTATLGMALAVLILAPEVYLPLRRAGAEFHASAAGQAAAERILDVLDLDAPSVSPPAGEGRRVPVPDLRSTAITLSGVDVAYGGRDLAVLDDLDLTIVPGEHLVVTGPSGSGKSTLLAVLLGFVEPRRGRVAIGATDLRDVSLRHWREQIAWVPQRPYLVRGTIADNLRIGDGHAGEDAVARAVALCGLSDLVAQLPLGLATPVGEGGLTLSAGERQRIALGRAVLRDAPLVLLDEPTAHVDTAREEALRDALSPWLEGRTVVVAAHRSGLVGRVDRIVHLVGGHLVDMPGSIDVRSAVAGRP